MPRRQEPQHEGSLEQVEVAPPQGRRATDEVNVLGGEPDGQELAGEVLAGTRSAVRDIIVVNAACAIFVADQAATLPAPSAG